MLLKVQPDGTFKNMHVAYFPELVLFFADMIFPKDQDAEKATIRITFRPPHGDAKTLDVPLIPDTADLEKIQVNMHSSPTAAYKMASEYNTWLSECLGYEAILAYLGNNTRSVLMSATPNPKPSTTNGWLTSIASALPTSLSPFTSTPQAANDQKITFADCAPFLVASETSLSDVSARLPQEMDMTKFRPNIIVSGAPAAWEEDYWSCLRIPSSSVTLHLVQNCVRCVSVNIDYATGKPGVGESGTVLKKLQKDRRVDKGAKYSPVFGRYAVLGTGCEGLVVSKGDEVVVVARNEERTVFGEFLSLLSVMGRGTWFC